MTVIIEPARGAPSEVRRARYVLRTSTSIPAPLDSVFAFFSDPTNLAVLTPPSMQFRIVETPPVLERDARIRYGLRVGFVPITWRTRIMRWEPGRLFVDVQESGPYAFWWHEHAFRRDPTGTTTMTDSVYYAPPFGRIGRVANALFVAPSLRRIFRYRAEAIRRHFAGSS